VRIRVGVADLEILREGFKAIFETEPGFEVVGVAGPSDDVLEFVEETRPEVLLLNPRPLVTAGPDICARLVERHPRLRVLLVSAHPDLDLVRACITAGAHGYVIKGIERRELLRAVRSLHVGDVTVTPAVAARIIGETQVPARVRTRPSDWRSPSAFVTDDVAESASVAAARLTLREREVLERLMDGQRVAWIAADLFVSASTVRDHLSSIFRKVGVHSQAELIRRLGGG
jgi:DNA-binding NarL/FixJ family response regulator